MKTYRSCQHLDLLYSLSKEDIAPYISEESRRLHVQRNTIAYRLDHIRTTRLDLDDPWLQQEYCISCELLQIESEKQS